MDFLLPKLSATMETAKVGRWFKQSGESVKTGEVLVELETDKATLEVESPVDGIVAEIVGDTGAELEIGAVLVRLDVKGAVSAVTDSAPSRTSEKRSPAQTPRTASEPNFEAKPARLLSSPLARRLAGLHGVDLGALQGSGPYGRIRKRDVLGAVPSSTSAQPAAMVGMPAVPGAPEPLSPMRSGIAASVTLSRQTIPSFVLDRWIDTSAVEHARALLSAGVEEAGGVKLTFTDFLLQAVADSLGQSPQLLDRYVEEAGRPSRVRGGSIDIGLVVAVSDGVMIPVLRDLGGKSLAAIAGERQAAVQRARSGRLSQADYAPPAISISNIGRSGADRFEAIISPDQTSILAVGREHEKVVPRGGAIAISKGVNVTLSADHRLIDGLTGAGFLGILADRMRIGPWSAG